LSKPIVYSPFFTHFLHRVEKMDFIAIAISSIEDRLLRFGGRTRRITQDTAKGGMHPPAADFISYSSGI